MSKEELEKIEYHRKVETMLSVKDKQSMIQLLEMGYSNFNENEILVKKFGGDIDQILNHLLGL